MNIEYINAIPLRKIFDKLNLQPAQENDRQSFYASLSAHNEKHTLVVDHDTNRWHDSATGASGGPMEFIAHWLFVQDQHCSVVDVKDWFRDHIRYPSLQEGIPVSQNQRPKLKYAYKSPILNPLLICCIEEKCIPLKMARKQFSQIGVTNEDTGEEFLALGLKTEGGDWWAYSPHINAFVGNPAVTYIHGTAETKTAIHVFKDIFDYLAAVIIRQGRFNNDAIILNSYDCLEESGHFITHMNYQKVYTWFDNGKTGQQATKNYAAFCAALNSTIHKPQNRLYASAFDQSRWLMKQAKKAGS